MKIVEKGSLWLLREWLELEFSREYGAAMIGRIVDPLQLVRKERQKPAHHFQKNEFSTAFHARRRETLWSIFQSLTNLREVLSRFPGANKIEPPAWLANQLIDVF